MRREGVIIISLDEVIFISLGSVVSIEYVYMQYAVNDTKSPPTCVVSVIADNKNEYNSKEEEKSGEVFNLKKHLIVTGHKDGSVLIWSSKAYVGMLTKYKDEITCMSKCCLGTAIGTMRGYIYIWDNLLMN